MAICPFMSRPIVYSTVESGGDQEYDLFRQPCIKEDCQAWKTQSWREEKGFCKLIEWPGPVGSI